MLNLASFYRNKMNNMIFRGLLYAAALFFLLSCTAEMHSPSPENAEDESGITSKLIFTADNATAGKLIVRFTDAAARQIESQAATRSGDTPLTRSGIGDFDDVLEDVGVTSMRRLFPVNPKTEERSRAAGLHRWYVVCFDESVDLTAAAHAMAGVAEVSNVEFNQKLVHVCSKASTLSENAAGTFSESSSPYFNDPYLGRQWHYVNTGDTDIYSRIREGADINCEAAWKLCTGDPRVIVAVVDDCVQWDHPDLAANMWTNEAESSGVNGDDDGNGYADDVHGYNFVDGGPLAVSTYGDAPEHGTHVAGTIAAVNNNGIGVCGIAGGSGSGDGVRIMSCQIFHNDGGGESAITAEAIRYAADNGASILQCSWGYSAGAVTSDSEYRQIAGAEKAAIDYFISVSNCDAVDGGIVIFASGNDMAAMSGYPAAYRDYISVTAISCDYTPAYYTNYGPGCNIAAPGGDAYQSLLESDYTSNNSQILSTITGGLYGYSQGTSMACPHVSGVAALGLSYALQQGLSFTCEEFNSLLLSSVYDINMYCTGTKQYVDPYYGYRRNLSLTAYRNLMGTGAVDAFRLLMNMRGTTCIPVTAGEQVQIDMGGYIGEDDAAFTISDVTISREDMDRLGMESEPSISGKNITVRCGKTGSGIMQVTITAGTGNTGIQGMPATREFAIISRASHQDNGGWL